MMNTTEERIRRQIKESTMDWEQLSESESKYLHYELPHYKPAFTEDNVAYWSYEGRPLRIVQDGQTYRVEVIR